MVGIEEHKDMIIPCLGGLHIVINCLCVIGRHMSEFGLSELGKGCDILESNAAQHIMAGNRYARDIRTHKLTLHADWQLLLPLLYTYLDGVDVALRAELSEVCTSIDADHMAQMVDKLTIGGFRDAMKGFAAALVVENQN